MKYLVRYDAQYRTKIFDIAQKEEILKTLEHYNYVIKEIQSRDDFPKPKTQEINIKIEKNNIENKIIIDLDYNKEIIDYFKTITGRKYDHLSKRRWEFPLNQFKTIKDNLEKMVLDNAYIKIQIMHEKMPDVKTTAKFIALN